jgi:death-on-curing protein
MAWRWLFDAVVVAMLDETCAEHGGVAGVRDEGLLSSALARPKNKNLYGEANVFDLAAAYAFGLVRDHPFLDGNKRIGFLAAVVFLELNGWRLRAAEGDAVEAVLSLARGDWDEAAFAGWLKTHAEDFRSAKVVLR